MAANASLSRAKAVQNDEFYTQYSDIEAEINAYIEFNPDVFRDKAFSCHVTIRNGRTSRSILRLISIVLALKS